MKYTTTTKLKEYIQEDISDIPDATLDSYIEAASRYIEKQTNRVFIADSQFQTRKYDGTGDRTLVVDDFIELDKVVQGEEEMENILTYPANHTPKTWLIAEKNSFRSGNQNIEINAKWGYSQEAPADIEFVATVLSAGMVNASKNKSKVESESIGQYRISYRNDSQLADFKRVKDILWSYRRHL